MFENLPLKHRPTGFNLPLETRATCANCVMASSEWPREARDAGPFASDKKCCTYAPFLPNFSLGRILRDDPARETFIRAKSDERLELTPLGFVPRVHESQAKCPFLVVNVSGNSVCDIWSERPSVCRSYFCISDQGAAGQAQWREAEKLGNEREWTLANLVLIEMGFTADEIESRAWAEWKGREVEFFVRCSEIAETIDG